jgi:hypothetical protein
MNYFRKHYLFLILFGVFQITVSSQNKSTDIIIATPTASNLTYPQSVFVDSPNGHIWITDFSNHRVMRFDVSTLTSVSESEKLQLLQKFSLNQNYPNPFNGGTQITFSVRLTGNTVLSVYNLLGQKIITLFEGIATANTIYSITFDAKNLPSGIYLYSLHTDSGVEVKRMCLLK